MLVYPLALPTTRVPALMRLDMAAVVGVQPSPITLEETVYVWSGDGWMGHLEWGEMEREDGAAVIAFLAALNGREGTFLAGDLLAQTPQGAWAGTPLLQGAHAAGIKTITVDGFTGATTGMAGDFFQLGTGSASRLHMVTQDFVSSSGVATIEIWPSLRTAYADNSPLITSSPKGVWSLAAPVNGYDLQSHLIYGISIPITEARRG